MHSKEQDELAPCSLRACSPVAGMHTRGDYNACRMGVLNAETDVCAPQPAWAGGWGGGQERASIGMVM